MPRSTEGEQFLQHAYREPCPCSTCSKKAECASQEMACEKFYRYVMKMPFKQVEAIPSAYWLLRSGA